MLSSLIYKEWLKLRRVFWVPFALLALGLGDAVINFRHINEVIGPVMLWLDAVYYEKIFYSGIKFIGIFTGVWFALFQFVPECSGKRLRLLFHLPVDHRKALYFIALSGLLATLGVCLLAMGGVGIIISGYMPSECVRDALITCAPWMLASIPAYMGTSLTIMEPLRMRKMLVAGITALFILPLFESQVPTAYSQSLAAFCAITLLWSFPMSLLAYRFKRGTKW